MTETEIRASRSRSRLRRLQADRQLLEQTRTVRLDRSSRPGLLPSDPVDDTVERGPWEMRRKAAISALDSLLWS